MDDFRSLMYQYPRMTGQETPEGRPYWYSPEMGAYSEYTGTYPQLGGWVTMPTVDASGQVGSPVGMTDPITGEHFPGFKTQDEAERYARMRSRLR